MNIGSTEEENNEIEDTRPSVFERWDDDEFAIKEMLLRGIYSYGFEQPSPIQKKAILPIIYGNDIIAQAQSGTGKTGAFVISILEIVDCGNPVTQAIIMAPTRELSRQIYEVVTSMGQYLECRSMILVGGTSTDDDKEALAKICPHIVVGCPGRIHDMVRRGHLKTTNVKVLILDEADEMLSVGFKEQVYTIFQYLQNDIQVGLFSATMPVELFTLTEKFMRNPIKILVKQEALTLQGIVQHYINLDSDQQKFSTLKDIFSRVALTQCIIYCNSVKRVKDLYEAMSLDNYPVARIHGDMTDEERKDTFKKFRIGTCRVLISSNVTARGLDVQQVSIVINFDIPKDNNTYLHRIGRSGRWGRKGVAINFVTRRDYAKIKELEQYYNTTISELPENFDSQLEI
jgi:translation initiation factor 4A